MHYRLASALALLGATHLAAAKPASNPINSSSRHMARDDSDRSVQVLWTSGSFDVADGGNGKTGHDSGFALTDKDGNEWYADEYPDDHSPCYSTDDGRTFTLSSPCWNQDRQFKCKSDLGGNPDSCEVLDADGNSLGSASGDTDYHYNGLGLSTDSSCVVVFSLDDDENCDKDSGWTIS